MSTVDLDTIRWRWGRYTASLATDQHIVAHDLAHDVPALLAEVERLRAELADERAGHAKTISNFEGFADAAHAARARLRHELEDARRDATRARQALAELLNTGVATGEDSTDG